MYTSLQRSVILKLLFVFGQSKVIYQLIQRLNNGLNAHLPKLKRHIRGMHSEQKGIL